MTLALEVSLTKLALLVESELSQVRFHDSFSEKSAGQHAIPQEEAMSKHNLTSPSIALVLILMSVPVDLHSSANGQELPKIRIQQVANVSPIKDQEESQFPESERGGIKEIVPAKYQKRYQAWKTEFMSTEAGRSDWEMYAHNGRFTLTIVVSCEKRNGASVEDNHWDDSGRLNAVTITLGCRIDELYPRTIYYPVTGALAAFQSWPLPNRGKILAATKMAHEFGHVKRLASMDGAQRQLQERTVPLYNGIFRSNGYNTNDPRLMKLAQMMGGTPIQIFADDEYFAEANAMLYIHEKLEKGLLPCSLLTRIKENLALYASSYEQSFIQIAESELYTCSSKRRPRLVAETTSAFYTKR